MWTKNNVRCFFKNNYKSLMITFGMFLGVLALFLMVTLALQATNNVSELFKLNYQKGLQLIISGFNLGVTSYIMQRITRNRLTDTAVMGFGSINLIPLVSLAYITNFTGNLNSTKPLTQAQFWNLLPILFIGFSVVLSLIFHFFSKNKKLMNHSKLLIAGVILNFICIAIALSVKGKLDYAAAPVIGPFIVGFVRPIVPLPQLLFCLIISIVAYVWLFFLSPYLKVLITNQQLGLQVGINNNSIHLQTFLIIGMMIGSSYSLTGDFVYVGLFAGNIAFMIFKNKVGWGTLTSGLTGAVIILATYFIFDNCIHMEVKAIPQLIPLLIAPYFLILLFRRNKDGNE